MEVVLTPGVLIVLISWIASAVGAYVTKDADVFLWPFLITLGWAAHYALT